MIGIYLIKNTVNGKMYVGQSVDIEKRWKNHLSASENTHEKVYEYPLYRAMRKYGKDNFKHFVLEEWKRELLDEREKYWIRKLRPDYNQTDGGNQGFSRNAIDGKKVYKIQQSLINDKQFIHSNKEIAKKYGISVNTILRINRGVAYHNENFIYPLRNIKEKECKKSYCVDCGKTVDNRSVRCRHCASVKRMCEKIFSDMSRDDIKKIIRMCSSYRKASTSIGVSNSGLKIICKRLGLPENKNKVNSYSDYEWEFL